MHNKFLISIVGPTAIGKTSLGIHLAQVFAAEIISADSRQFYKEMRIGTAAPTKEELSAATHHFIHHISVEDDYSVGDFEREALDKTYELFEKNPFLIMVGGSGLYVKSLLEGLDFFPEVNPGIREGLNKELEEKGLASLQWKLKLMDPGHYREIDIENPHRVIRALEISLGTGQPYSSFLNKPKEPRSFTPVKIGLDAPREVIYDRINRRVELMMRDGLMEEVQRLYSKRNLNALNTVGYNELFSYLDGELNLEEAVEKIKQHTRNFAKRQLTWFRKDMEINWFDYETPVEEIAEFIQKKTTF